MRAAIISPVSAPHGHDDWVEATVGSLNRKGLRNGSARRAVIELLAAQKCCLSAQEIFDTLRTSDRRVGIASVYRILDLLTSQGFAQRIDLGSGVSRYEPIWPDSHHHHHLICDSCGKVDAFQDSALEHALGRVEANSGYAVAGHDVVLHGTCHDCR